MSDTPRTDKIREAVRVTIGTRQATATEAGLIREYEKLERELTEAKEIIAYLELFEGNRP